MLCLLGGAACLATPLPDGLNSEARLVGLTGAIMAILWMTEAMPLAVTALLPLVALPLAGVLPLDKVGQSYAHPLVFLFLGGFMLAAALQRWGLHRKLAVSMLRFAGSEPHYQVLVIMVVTGFLSMWISNTATAMVMMPIGLSILSSTIVLDTQTSQSATSDRKSDHGVSQTSQFGAAMMLGIAFAATIGGIGSLIGTPPNAIFVGFLEQTYGVRIGFGQWMLIGVPIVIVLLPVTWLLLTRFVFDLSKCHRPNPEEGRASEPLTAPQWTVAIVLLSTALTWLLRPVIAEQTGFEELSDAGIALTGALLLFLIPSGVRTHGPLLTWDDVKELRWDVLILFGGGLALADAIASTGLAQWIGGMAQQLDDLPVVILILLMMIIVVYLGELASNTAMAAVFLPIAGAVAVGLDLQPIELLLPVALAASLGFMLPVATPPNAIVYGSGAVSARQMLKAGAMLDVISIAIVFAAAELLGSVLSIPS